MCHVLILVFIFILYLLYIVQFKVNKKYNDTLEDNGRTETRSFVEYYRQNNTVTIAISR